MDSLTGLFAGIFSRKTDAASAAPPGADTHDVVPPGERTKDLYVVVLDESGSMTGTEHTTMGSLADFHAKQQNISRADSPFKIFAFSTAVSVRFSATLGAKLSYAYKPDGGTALYDAIGHAVEDCKSVIASAAPDAKPDDVYVIILTDGQENSSKSYNSDSIRRLIDEQQQQHDWKFIFLAANQDAMTAGTSMGISREACLDFAQSDVEQRSAMTSVSAAISRQKIAKSCAPPSARTAVAFSSQERYSSKTS